MVASVTTSIVQIQLYEELPTRAQNRLRYAIQMGMWLQEWRKAKETSNYAAMDRLDREYELVGLP
jgi:hypothetical protein